MGKKTDPEPLNGLLSYTTASVLPGKNQKKAKEKNTTYQVLHYSNICNSFTFRNISNTPIRKTPRSLPVSEL